MKISHKIISIPPYISTHWKNVLSIHTIEESILVVTLADGDAVYIPDLSPEQISQVFKAHTAYLEEMENEHSPSDKKNPRSQIENQFTAFIQSAFGVESGQPFQMSFSNLDNIQNVLQHNPQQADAPDLPSEMLEKVAAITKMMAPDPSLLPKAEPHCNCIHCQIARSVSGQPKDEEPSSEMAEVTSDDLQFQAWEIQQSGDKLFTVTNKLDRDEKYSVYLGEPLGCTCGKTGCEHIVAVLQS